VPVIYQVCTSSLYSFNLSIENQIGHGHHRGPAVIESDEENEIVSESEAKVTNAHVKKKVTKAVQSDEEEQEYDEEEEDDNDKEEDDLCELKALDIRKKLQSEVSFF